MKGKNRRKYAVTGIFLMAGLACSGCIGGGSRIYDQVGEDISRSDLNPDSIPAAPDAESYFIGYGDVLDINFLYETEYSRDQLKVRPDGRITYPYAGEIFVAGMTPSGLDSILTDKFAEIIVDPHITVLVRDFTPQKIYVLGEVDTPGGYKYVRDMTLMQALAEGRGYTRDARKSNVLLIRRVAEDHIIGIEVNIDAILTKNDFSLDLKLKPYDIVYVPMSRIASAEQFIERITNIIANPMDLYLKGWQVANASVLYEFYAARAVQ